MKLKSLAIAALVAVTAGQSVNAADTVINITGATAFRKAAIDAIISLYGGNPSTGATISSFNYATSGTTANSAGAATFVGTFPGITGTTTIRCSWLGSVEGIRALTTPNSTNNAKYITDLTGLTLTNGIAKNVATDTKYNADFAFSDVLQSSTPEQSVSLNPASPGVGILVFVAIAQKGSTLTNITKDNFADLFSNGYTRKYTLTGNTLDTGRVFLVGRNDGSGSRTTVLAANGFGIAKPVKHYVARQFAGGTIGELQLVPANGIVFVNGTSDATYVSTVWGNNADGNGGYNSGGTMAGNAFANTCTNGTTRIISSTGTTAPLLGSAPNFRGSCDIVSWISSGDVASNIGNVTTLAYNGVSITINGSGNILSATDKAKVTSGQYQAWGTENLYYNTLSSDQTTFDTAIRAKLKDPTIIDAVGVNISDMSVARTPQDGGAIGPKSR